MLHSDCSPNLCSAHPLLREQSTVEAQCIREFRFPNGPSALFLALECPGSLGIGGKVWDSTYVLLRYLALHSDLIRGRSVFEFGSGTGLAGIVYFWIS
jgi:hypothetical protein